MQAATFTKFVTTFEWLRNRNFIQGHDQQIDPGVVFDSPFGY